MKLKNLLEELFPTQLNTTNTNRTLQDKPMAQGDVGTGTYSSVSAKKNDPFLVRKTSDTFQGPQYDAKEQDGYWTYIEGIVKNPELKDNPFFPRVYNIKTIKDPRGKAIYRADIEKLEPLTSLDKSLVIRYFASILNKEKTKEYLEKHRVRSQDGIIAECVYLIDKSASEGNYDFINNAQLAEALQYIHSLSNKFGVDIHSENIMFRRGSYGLQLVITDPLSHSET
jgi:hypothetical protein